MIENFHEEKFHPTHYTQFATIENIEFQVREVLKSNSYYDRYIGKVLQVNDNVTSGTILVYVQKDSLQASLSVDDVIYTTKTPQEVRAALNPTSFDYKTYLSDRYVYSDLRLKTEEFIFSKNTSTTLYGWAYQLRRYIHKQLVKYEFKADELAVIEALLLGQRQEISKELRDNYTNAGAIHILAISGLHIGIIVMMLQFLLNPLQRWKSGKLLKLVLMIVILWSFAFVSGLSASVVRAVTMFTALAIATHLKRQTNTLQVLTVSMFFLLLCKPHFLFDVGFQLSYAAVFSIVCLQPLWKKLWNPKTYVASSFWSLLTVSFSAQIGVLPLSLYYFHQFPSLFFVTNLTIIPVLGCILVCGIVVIVLASADCLPAFIADVYMFVIQQMNSLVSWVASHEEFVLKDIPMTWFQMIGLYLIIITFTYYGHVPKRKPLTVALCSVLFCQGIWFYHRFQQYSHEDSFSIFHQNKTSILASEHGNTLQLYHELDSLAFANNYIIQQQLTKEHITEVLSDSIRNVYKIHDEYVLRIDSLGIYQVPQLKPAYVLLTNSPKIHLDRMIDSLQPKQIIADGSNYRSYVQRWRSAAQKRKIPFHYTGEKGFYRISLQK